MKRFIYIIIGLNLILPSENLEKIEKNIDKRNSELNAIKKEIENIEKEINKKIKEEKTYNEIIIQIDDKIKLTEKLIRALTQEENYLSNLIYETEENISIKQKELEEMQNQLKNRVRYLYKYGKNNILSQIISNRSWSDKIYRIKYLQILNESEDKIKKRISENIKTLKLEQKALQKEKNRKSYLITEKDNEFIKLGADKKKKHNYIGKIQKQKKELKTNLQFKKDAMAQIETLINKLYNDKEELRKREEELIRLRAEKNKSTSGNFAKMKKKLPWPVEGEIVGRFGIQKNIKLNTQYENIGIDIKTKPSERVFSVLDGVVLSITNINGYGNVIIIDHGNGYYTVYSNIENIKVIENEYIDSSFQLGTVSKNINSHYNHQYVFHFQIWGNKQKLNPLYWLKNK